MKNVLIINGHQKYDVMAEGKLTQTYIQSADNFFKENEFKVKHSIIESNYVINDELEKFKWADYILFQYPIYWMSLPWLTKKYIDEIFNAGYQKVTHQSEGMSTSSFHAHFKKVTSHSPLQYIKKIRLHKAKSLISNEHLNVNDAADKMGYVSVSQFSKDFKSYFGYPPKDAKPSDRESFL